MRVCPLVNVCLLAHAREADTLAMLEASDTPALDTSAHTPPGDDSVQVLRDLIERMQAEIKFKQTRIEALNFEIARLKRWRFGSSAESLDSSTQAVLFDAILADTDLEDQAARDAAAEAAAPAPAAPKAKRKAVRRRCPPTCRALIATMSSVPRTAPVARPSRASAKRSASNSTACRPSSSCCATSAANTPARAARRSRPHRCPRR